jgi:hypothetical protein
MENPTTGRSRRLPAQFIKICGGYGMVTLKSYAPAWGDFFDLTKMIVKAA